MSLRFETYINAFHALYSITETAHRNGLYPYSIVFCQSCQVTLSHSIFSLNSLLLRDNNNSLK